MSSEAKTRSKRIKIMQNGGFQIISDKPNEDLLGENFGGQPQRPV
jgi:hypothetical protein